MRTSRAHIDKPWRAGFTLVEMLVAVGMGAALVASAASVFALASQSIKSSQANTEISSNLRVVCSWLQRDFNRMRLDGPLLIQPETYVTSEGTIPEPRADRIFFVISGDIPSLTQPNFHAALAMVTYGQDAWAAVGPPDFSTFLTRQAGLIAANPPSGSSEIYAWSFAGLLSVWYSTPTPGDNIVSAAAGWVRPDFDDPTSIDWGYTRMLDKVSSFEVVGYAEYDSNGIFQYVPVDLATASENLRFDPHEKKPIYIDFRIIFRDSNKVVTEGYTATYRVHLPTE